ncbi:TPA: tyrosine-type recombinase/integrase [Vibrio parahaemolyticus]
MLQVGKRSPYNFKKVWTKILQDFKFHDLRRASVSRLVEGGLSAQQVTAISGHKSMQMLRRYTHLRAEELVEELDAIAKGLAKAPLKCQ